MTTISNTLYSPSATQSTAATNANMQLDQTDFLKLMTVQLTTQDPFKPVENTEMIAQMAQFSATAGIAEMNQSLKSITEAFSSGRLTDASGWIGRSILVESDVVPALDDGAFAGQIALPKAADKVNLAFVDETGAVVHSEQLGAQDAGELSFAWDGKRADGSAVEGPLKVVVNASVGGEPVEAVTAVWTQVGGIQSPAAGGKAQLVTGLGLLSPDDAIRLS